MLAFKGKPKFLKAYRAIGFDIFQTFGEIGQLQLVLHHREKTGEPHLKAYAGVQEALGEEVTCSVDDWSFVGIVTDIEYSSAARTFRITLNDTLVKFDGEIGSNVFADQTIKDIVSSVAPSGVKIEYVGGFDGITVKLAIRYQESAFRFIKRLLAGFGGQIWCAEDTVYIGAGPTSKSKSLRLGKDVADFRIATRLGAEDVELESIPYAKNNPKTSKIELKKGNFGAIQDDAVDLRKKGGKAKRIFHIIHENTKYDDSKHIANSFLRSQAAGRFMIEGRVMMPVELGSKVTVQGAGADSETTIVRSIQCIGDYENTRVVWHFQAVNPESVISDEIRKHDKLITSTAVVEKSNDDLNRVQVKFPWDGNKSVTPWLRIAAPSWGKEHMHFLPPRKGDTVLVVWGQIDMDPIVLGCVTAGDKVGQPNATLMFQTVDGQEISIGKNNITMKNNGVEIRMDQDLVEIDSAGSKIKMDPSTVEIKATGSITLDAPAGINLKTVKLDVG